jgi:hypothetical protein
VNRKGTCSKQTAKTTWQKLTKSKKTSAASTGRRLVRNQQKKTTLMKKKWNLRLDPKWCSKEFLDVQSC